MRTGKRMIYGKRKTEEVEVQEENKDMNLKQWIEKHAEEDD